MKKRVKRFVEAAICGLTDWLEYVPYREDDPSLRRKLGESAQLAWYHAHNNRLWVWAAFPEVGDVDG